jgi:hypothetical protein
MIAVFMGEEYSIQLIHTGPKHLLPEVGPGIDHHHLVGRLHKDRRTQPFVVFIF